MNATDFSGARRRTPPRIVYSLATCGAIAWLLLLAPILAWGQTPAHAPGPRLDRPNESPSTGSAPPGTDGSQSSPTPAAQPSDAGPPGGIRGYVWSFPAMGTMVTFKTFHRDPAYVEQVFRQAERLVHELDAILTDYQSESETRRLSTCAVDRPTAVSAPLWDVLSAADSWHDRTGGAVDPTVGSLTRLWRKYRGTNRWPTEESIALARKNTGWQHVHLDPQERTIRLDRPVQFDFGAIGKGYAVDRVFELLQRAGLRRSLVNISGNMRLGDPPPEREGWRIELAPLNAGGRPLGRVILSNTSIATSGDLWQAIEIQGVRRSHILDPRTGWGVEGPRSATAITQRAIDADALATAGCILSPEDALKLADSIGAQLLTVRLSAAATPEMHRTEGFPALQDADRPAADPPPEDPSR